MQSFHVFSTLFVFSTAVGFFRSWGWMPYGANLKIWSCLLALRLEIALSRPDASFVLRPLICLAGLDFPIVDQQSLGCVISVCVCACQWVWRACRCLSITFAWLEAEPCPTGDTIRLDPKDMQDRVIRMLLRHWIPNTRHLRIWDALSRKQKRSETYLEHGILKEFRPWNVKDFVKGAAALAAPTLTKDSQTFSCLPSVSAAAMAVEARTLLPNLPCSFCHAPNRIRFRFPKPALWVLHGFAVQVVNFSKQ